MTEYIYAICRSYEKDPNRMFDDESVINVGIEHSPLKVQDFNLFKVSKSERSAKLDEMSTINKVSINCNYVVRMEEFGRANGVVFGAIEDNYNKVKLLRIIPLDDLVEPSKIISSIKENK